MNVSREAAKLLVANVVDALVAVVALVVFARVLGAGQLGVFFLFQAVLRLLKIPADIGIPGAAEKRISAGAPAGEVLSTALLTTTLSVSLIAIIVFLGGDLVRMYIAPGFVPLLAIGLVVQTLSILVLHVLRGELRAGDVALPRILRRVTWFAFGLLLIEYGFGASGLAIALITGDAVMFLVGYRLMDTRLGKPTMKRLRSLFDYARFNLISDVGFYSYNWIDIIAIGVLATQAAVGAYEVAWRITTMVMLMGNSIIMVMFPQVSAWHAENERNRIEELIRRVMAAALLLVVPALFGVLVLGKSLLQYVFGQEFTVAALALVVLMAGKILESINSVVGRALQAMDHPNLVALSSIVAAGANVVLNPLLILEFGLTGAAVATTVSFGIYTALNLHFISDYLRIQLPTLEVVWMVAAATGMASVSLVIASIAPIDGVITLVAHVLLGTVVYVAAVLAAPPLRRDIRATIADLRDID